MRNKNRSILGTAEYVFGLVLCGLLVEVQNSPGETQAPASQKIQPSEVMANSEVTDEVIFEKSENPISNQISLPIQNNYQFNTGISHATVEVYKLQPVIPFHINEDWDLITRTIVPITNQPSVKPNASSAFGLGDINPQLYFSPAKSGAITWGIGPTFTFPTGTDDTLTSGKWSAGPAGGVVYTHGDLVTSLLVNNQWSFAGWRKQAYNQLSLQPGISYKVINGWYVTYSPTMTANGRLAVATVGPFRSGAESANSSILTNKQSRSPLKPLIMWSTPPMPRIGPSDFRCSLFSPSASRIQALFRILNGHDLCDRMVRGQCPDVRMMQTDDLLPIS
jgi:hypothetical protein